MFAGSAHRPEGNLDVQQRNLDEGRRLLFEATDLDQKGQSDQALPVYKRGKTVLSNALALSFAPHEKAQAATNESKIQEYIALVDERINAIQKKTTDKSHSWLSFLSSAPAQPPTPTPAPAKPNSAISPRHNAVTHKQATPTRAVGTRTPTSTLTTPTHASRARHGQANNTTTTRRGQPQDQSGPPPQPPIRGVDKEMQHRILDEVVDRDVGVKWDDIAGLQQAKQAIQEIIILPYLRPDLFTGLRAPPKGVLLYGPPGTGKTMLAKAIASESKMTFFSISASSLMSKWVGDGEKMVRALFAVARHLQPSVVFVDEIDSMLGERREGENDAARRVKTEFLVQFDGVGADANDKILILGATNLPWSLDEAARRRMVKRIYIPLPDADAREALIFHLLKDQLRVTNREMKRLVEATAGYSGSDLKALCSEAAMGPVRELGPGLLNADASKLRSVNIQDFRDALNVIRPSVRQSDLKRYEEWSQQFGMSGA